MKRRVARIRDRRGEPWIPADVNQPRLVLDARTLEPCERTVRLTEECVDFSIIEF